MKKLNFLVIFSLVLGGCTNLPSAPVADAAGANTPTSEPINAVLTYPPEMTPSALPAQPTTIPPLTFDKFELMILNGQYDQVRSDIQTTSGGTSLPGNLWLLAKTEYLSENYSAALEILRTITRNHPNTVEANRSWFLIAEILYILERYEDSLNAYLEYQKVSPLFERYILIQIGNCYSFTGEYKLAIEAFNKVLTDDPSNESIRIKIGRAFLYNDQPDQALEIFEAIFETTNDDYTKAQLDLLSGQAYINQGDLIEGYARRQHAVANYPLAYDSYSALSALITDGQEVNEFDRGLVDYYAGQYDVALTAFNKYITLSPDHDGTVYFYLGLIHRETGNYTLAVQAFDTLIEKYGSNRLWTSAWDEKAYTLWAYMDDYPGGAKVLEDYSTYYQGSNLAATYLIEAGRIRERNQELEKACQLWESLPIQFPESNDRYAALMYAGVTRFRLEQYGRAIENFQHALNLSKDDPEITRANFWLGKSYDKMGNRSEAIAIWERTLAIDPIGYYGLRSNELINGQQPFTRREILNDHYDLSVERKDAAAWLQITLNIPSSVELLSLGQIQEEIHFKQGLEYWNLGLFESSKVEFDLLMDKYSEDPLNLFRLGNYLLDIGLYKSGIHGIRNMLTLLGYEDHYRSINVPDYFNHVRYGLYYYDLVKENAAKYDLDPLLVLSVMRQESLFEGFIHSSAGARGLMQIMPATGESIAQQMGLAEYFNIDQLDQPNVSLALGTHYINSNMNYLNKDMFAVLAAYNAGPGNASIWQSLAGGDQDLELEVIRFGEPREYIKSIFETYFMYQKLYSIRN